MGQPLKKKESRRFSVKDFKTNLLGDNVKSADKPMEWIIMPEAYQEALKLPGIPMGRVTMIRGWQDTGKTTLKNLAIASAMRQGILPVIFETESNFDFQYAKDCGMPIEPVYGDVDVTDPITGEAVRKREIVDWEGDYFLFTPNKICAFCGDIDYATGKKMNTRRTTPVIEDIAYIINTFLEKQEKDELPMPILFAWDSVGSCQSLRSYNSKVGNNMFDAGAIATAFKPIFPRLESSKEIGREYTNTMIVINKIWQDTQNSMGGAVAIANSGGKTFDYGIRLGIHLGGTARSGTKKLKATLKGEEYQYGNITKISVFKNHLPTPYNITYSGTMCCVHNGIIPESKIDEYKKKEIPILINHMRELNGKNAEAINSADITYSESGRVEDYTGDVDA